MTILSSMAPVVAQECMVGEVIAFAGTYTPANWLDADGRMLDIQQYSSLFSLLGPTYGGDGQKFSLSMRKSYDILSFSPIDIIKIRHFSK